MLLAVGSAIETDSSATATSPSTQPTHEQLHTLLRALLAHLSPHYANSSSSSSSSSSASATSMIALQHGAVDVYLTILWALVLQHPGITYTSHDATGTQVLIL
jgi:hypothetical protein